MRKIIFSVALMATLSAFGANAPETSPASGPGGGHDIKKCDGTVVALDQYDVNDDRKPIHLNDDPRINQQYKDWLATVDQIRTKYPGFAATLDHLKTVYFFETCQPLQFVNDHQFDFQGTSPVVGQAALHLVGGAAKDGGRIGSEWDYVLFSTDKLNNPSEVKSVLYHEFFKIRFGEDMDRDLLRSLVDVTTASPLDMDKFAEIVNQIDKKALSGLDKIEVVCVNCLTQPDTNPTCKTYGFTRADSKGCPDDPSLEYFYIHVFKANGKYENIGKNEKPWIGWEWNAFSLVNSLHRSRISMVQYGEPTPRDGECGNGELCFHPMVIRLMNAQHKNYEFRIYVNNRFETNVFANWSDGPLFSKLVHF